jgi:CRISPR type III-B/RAMP module-associated protein Cmr5
MQNLDQIRARNALKVASNVQKKSVTKLPALIVNNGLLAAAAFARDKSEGLLRAMNALAAHLLDPEINRIEAIPQNERARDYAGSTDDLLHYLKNQNSDRLRLATDESLAFLSYLKRFAKSEE